ncbi:Endoribonuclease L-PSP/chorismate mutase-like protein [Akanthomyces lecanii RCEF 1005]|uniref:Endoribonuclease L-PSP/chorismate mutase-like protein n=1 Tax=Akanthomyces lecanii RCEF 1005 TaxID=1081108 RepID=A0A168KDH4_CORDF|nr:Endoribonuclease L-PSP/chorismate mutase-like protein [Akanthomyces lecanii RCEF 1005]
MTQPKYYSYPGLGEWAKENFHYSQAIRIGDRILCSGQDKIDFENLVPEDVAAQVDQAFANCDMNVRHAGGGRGLAQAYKVVTYATDLAAAHEHIVRNLRRWMPENPPIWTELGVAALGAPGMKFEIDVEAYDPDGAKKELA